MAKDIFRGSLEQVDTCCWRIPKSYKQGMRVDGLIFTNERLLEQLKLDQAPDQVANVAFLPGIQHASLAMPDIHWGYGFCIGGVCATDPEEGGVISPGGVGYDINCLTYDSKIIHGHGYHRPIGELSEAWRRADLSCHDLETGGRASTSVCRWFAQKPRRPILRLVTESGDAVRATGDHPFWTPDGMIPLGRLSPGDRVAMAPFEGVPYEAPCDDVIVSENDFTAKWSELGQRSGGHALPQTLRYLTTRGLLPLRYSSPALPYLCKLLGFIFGDGSLHFVKQTSKGIVTFYGQGADLETIRADVQALGIIPCRVYRRDRHHCIQTPYATVQFHREEEWFKIGGSGFAVLLACLGTPIGNKACQDYDAPAWLDAAPLWHKRLFLAALFGAELTTPATIADHGSVFGAPTLCMNKRVSRVASGRRFLQKLSAWLQLFGVDTQAIHARTEQMNKDGERSIRLRLILSPKIESLRKLWARVGYEYNRKRAGLAALAVQYLKHKERHLTERSQAAESIRALVAQGTARQAIFAAVSASVNER
ncbi:MAG: RtcB family protein, partial [Gemmataceae bacterium]